MRSVQHSMQRTGATRRDMEKKTQMGKMQLDAMGAMLKMQSKQRIRCGEHLGGTAQDGAAAIPLYNPRMKAMHVTDLAINRAMGMQPAPAGRDHILELPESAMPVNHVGTIHASVQFALAEAGSGEFLLRQLGEAQEQAFAVLRTSTVKFRKPEHGELRAIAQFADANAAQWSAALASRGRALVPILIEVADTQGVVTMTGRFDWFLQKQRDEA